MIYFFVLFRKRVLYNRFSTSMIMKHSIYCCLPVFCILFAFAACSSDEVDCSLFHFRWFIDDHNIFTYIHLSDTHLSIQPDAARNGRFREFVERIIPSIHPELVIHSGDITDGWLKGVSCTFLSSNIIILIMSSWWSGGRVEAVLFYFKRVSCKQWYVLARYTRKSW